MVSELEWLESLPCGCQDAHFRDGSVDHEHDHVECDGTPEAGSPVLSEARRGPAGRVDYVQEWYVLPPEDREHFTVTREYWRENEGDPTPVREIYAWRN